MKKIGLFLINVAFLFLSSQAQAWEWKPKKQNEDELRRECASPCYTSPAGYDIVKRYEGFVPVVYIDAAGYPTIGYGHLIKPSEKFTGALTPDRAVALLRSDMRFAETGVNKLARPPLRQHQFDALVSWTFNLGTGALKGSTVLKKVNARQHTEVPDQIRRWVNAGGRKLQGLVLRRNAEASLYAGT